MNEKRYLTPPKVASAILDYYHYVNSEETRISLVRKIEKVCKHLPIKGENGYTNLWEFAIVNETAKHMTPQKTVKQASRKFTQEELNRIQNCEEIFDYFYKKYLSLKDSYSNADISKYNEFQLIEYNFIRHMSENMQSRIQAKEIFARDEFARGQHIEESQDFEAHISASELENHRCKKMLEALYYLFFEPVDTQSLCNDLNATFIDPDYNEQLLKERIDASNRLTNPYNYCKFKNTAPIRFSNDNESK